MEKLFEILDSFIDPQQECAGGKIIPVYKIEEMASQLIIELQLQSIDITLEEVIQILQVDSLRFANCGGNVGEKYGVIRKHTFNGWKKLCNKLTKKAQ